MSLPDKPGVRGEMVTSSRSILTGVLILVAFGVIGGTLALVFRKGEPARPAADRGEEPRDIPKRPPPSPGLAIIDPTQPQPPRPDPAPKPDPTPEPKPEPDPEPKPDPAPEPKPEPKPALVAGLRARYYDLGRTLGQFPPEDPVAKLHPKVDRIDGQINFDVRGDAFPGTGLRDNLFVRWTGFVRIPRDGRWTFTLRSDDGSRLWINGARVVDNDGSHAMQDASGRVELKQGDHELRVDFFEGSSDAGCILSWEGPGVGRQTVPASALFHGGPAGSPEPEAKLTPLPGTEMVLEAETFKRKNVETKKLEGASRDRAVYFDRNGGLVEGRAKLDEGTYGIQVIMRGPDTDHDAVFFRMAGREHRLYQDRWNRLAPGKISETDEETIVVKVSKKGTHEFTIRHAEDRVWVDRVIFRKLHVGALSRPDDEGFILDWLVLAPVPAEKEMNGVRELDRSLVRNERNVRPHAGEQVEIRGRRLAWLPHRSPDAVIDFRKLAVERGGSGEDETAYAVCVLFLEQDLKKLRLLMGSNDQAKVWINGKQLIQHRESRTLERDQDTAKNVTLYQGENLVVFKVVNEKNNWQGCLRFTDEGGRPVTAYRVGLPSP